MGNTHTESMDRLMKQLGYGGHVGIAFAVIAGEDEFAKNSAKVRDLATREEKELPLDGLAEGIAGMLRKRDSKL